MILKDCEHAGYKIICTFIVLYFNFEVSLTFLGTQVLGVKVAMSMTQSITTSLKKLLLYTKNNC